MWSYDSYIYVLFLICLFKVNFSLFVDVVGIVIGVFKVVWKLTVFIKVFAPLPLTELMYLLYSTLSVILPLLYRFIHVFDL